HQAQRAAPASGQDGALTFSQVRQRGCRPPLKADRLGSIFSLASAGLPADWGLTRPGLGSRGAEALPPQQVVRRLVARSPRLGGLRQQLREKNSWKTTSVLAAGRSLSWWRTASTKRI